MRVPIAILAAFFSSTGLAPGGNAFVFPGGQVVAPSFTHRSLPNVKTRRGSNPSSNEINPGKQNLNLPAIFLRNLWKGITLPFPTLRKIILNKSQNKDMNVGLRVRESLIGVAIYLLAGVLSYHFLLEESWSVVDSIYFTTTCFTTVGYGDLCPSNPASKLFTCLFGMGGIAFLGSAIATVGSSFVDIEKSVTKAAKEESKKRLMKVFEGMPKAMGTLKKKAANERKLHSKHAKKALMSSVRLPGWVADGRSSIRKLLPSLSIILFGGALINRLNGNTMSWPDSVYYSLITASTIGLGDLSPATNMAKIVSIFYIPLAVAAAGDLLSGVASSMMKRRQREVYRQQLEDAMTISYLDQMDDDGDGKISREEYLQFMLIEMGLVGKKDLDELDSQFDRLDADGSGYLATEDLKIIAEYRGVTITDTPVEAEDE